MIDPAADCVKAMEYGRGQYRDVIAHLAAAGLPVRFTQTGGMCAALQVDLPDGRHLLICDTDDSLSWDRADHAGWSVGLYPREGEDSTEPLECLQDPDGSLGALLPLLRRVLR